MLCVWFFFSLPLLGPLFERGVTGIFKTEALTSSQAVSYVTVLPKDPDNPLTRAQK